MCLPRPLASLQQSGFSDLIIAYRYNTSFSKIGDPDPDIHLDWYFFNTSITRIMPHTTGMAWAIIDHTSDEQPTVPLPTPAA